MPILAHRRHQTHSSEPLINATTNDDCQWWQGAILNRNTRREVKLSKSKAVARNRRTRGQMHPLGGNPFLSFPHPSFQDDYHRGLVSFPCV
ncbi:hypothetical protein CEXT_87561 [Caerostris extrusa]|uniref:Uncharacterized protein n=1 Tax=Caerostris extrusa TaxID=172846 RepID=A0AAV4Y1C3_CAEEX|nr:hypothetical protein CEXT_87561 [Caerostris extrusa]